jgi:hypothetical protein
MERVRLKNVALLKPHERAVLTGRGLVFDAAAFARLAAQRADHALTYDELDSVLRTPRSSEDSEDLHLVAWRSFHTDSSSSSTPTPSLSDSSDDAPPAPARRAVCATAGCKKTRVKGRSHCDEHGRAPNTPSRATCSACGKKAAERGRAQCSACRRKQTRERAKARNKK